MISDCGFELRRTTMDRVWIEALKIKVKFALRNLKFAILVSPLSFALSFLGALLFVLCSPAEAQRAVKAPRVGVLWPEGPENAARQSMTAALLQGLRELGYIEAKNIAFEYRYGEGRRDRVIDLAAELVSSKVDIIVTGGVQATRAARNATKTVSIVMIGVGPDPIEAGLVESLAHPGGNVTGFTNLSSGITGKRLELLKASVPKMSLVAFLVPSDEINLLFVKEVQTAARELGLIAQTWEVKNTDSIESVFARLGKERPHGLLVGGGPAINNNVKRFVNFALNNRLPSMYWNKRAVDIGGLMHYGTDPLDQYQRAAIYIDKILKGTKPADLPVQQPTKFEFIINLKAAKQIGLTIPPNVLARADRVIK
jgi:putative ABC transport system substrate-binding protein